MTDMELIKKVAKKATPLDKKKKNPNIIQHGKIEESLRKKAEDSGINFDIIRDVYLQGLIEGHTQNFAFDRVNSFIAWNITNDLENEIVEGDEYWSKHAKKLSDISSGKIKVAPPVKLKKEGYHLASGEPNTFRDDFIKAHSSKSGSPEGLEHFKKTYERLENKDDNHAVYKHKETGERYSLKHEFNDTTKRHVIRAEPLSEQTILEGGDPINKEKGRAWKAGKKIADYVKSREDVFSNFGIERDRQKATSKYASAVDKGTKKKMSLGDLEKMHRAGATFVEELEIDETINIKTMSADFKVIKYRKPNGTWGWRKIKRFRDIVK